MSSRLEIGDQAPATLGSPETTGKVARVARPWAYWPLRVVALVETVLIFDQAVYAGRFLSGDFPALHVHRENATYTGIVLLVQLIAAVLLRWPGGGPLWPAFYTAGMFGLIALQIVLGFSRSLVIHVPLGVGLVVVTVLMLVWVWRPKPHDWWPRANGKDDAAAEERS
ncbi:hypothetical protein Asp14428_76520 [Actinoplanes sp. NBRC 14428]|uniref:Uncharacterized protein n=1 Tax=Pseudosporangium ferrugineum TaxID=439699 RepID=A0A2T0RXK3_9ACTN|nr:hypothetical protein [Pseudosporangium ferrugineum]PRY25773.1 hypothetical protein CLV70_112139 [Pseudosporangium ferrugineum]BCJ56177.1 hypothetical protein Asp14428_76520 [Actinoplanes sp. NBRC 14428]